MLSNQNPTPIEEKSEKNSSTSSLADRVAKLPLPLQIKLKNLKKPENEILLGNPPHRIDHNSQTSSEAINTLLSLESLVQNVQRTSVTKIPKAKEASPKPSGFREELTVTTPLKNPPQKTQSLLSKLTGSLWMPLVTIAGGVPGIIVAKALTKKTRRGRMRRNSLS